MSELASAVAAVLDAREQSAGALVVAEVESGARLGVDAAGQWLWMPGDGRSATAFAAGSELHFAELVESDRRAFDDMLEAGAREHGLAPDLLLCSFPAVELVRAVLGQRSPYLVRLGLLWLLPSERGDARDAIQRVLDDPGIPRSLKDLARRLA